MTSVDPQNDAQSDDPGRLRQLVEESNRAAAEAQAELAQLKTRDLFRDAGLDPSNRQHAAFIKAYDGTLEGDAVRSYVTELGVTQPAVVEPPQNPASAEEQAALERMNQAAAGDGTPPPEPDRLDQLRRQMADAYSHNATKAELDRISEEFARAAGQQVVSDMPSKN